MSKTAKLSSPVTLVGHPSLAVGRGEHIRAIRRALSEANIAARVYDLWRSPRDKIPFEEPTSDLRAVMVEELGGGIRMFHCNGNEIDAAIRLLERRQPGVFDKGYNIVFPAWELPVYPAEWARQIERFDEVWSASDFVDAALRDAVSIPVVHIPNACEPHVTEILEREYFGAPPGAFLILFFFDLGSYATRKNPWAILEMFRRVMAERPEADIHLVMKVTRAELSADVMQRMRAELDALGTRATMIDRTITDNEVKNLIRCCDCFVSLHRSEGFGRGPAEAMFFGKPVVATGWSGNMEYMTPRVSFPIGFDLVPLSRDEYLHWEHQVWAEPHIDEAVGVVLRLIDDPHYGRSIGSRARTHMRRKYSDKVLGRRYAQRFAAINASERVPAG